MEQPNLALDPYPSRYGCCHVTCFSSATARQHQNPQVAAETVTTRNTLRAPLHSLRDVGGPNQKQNYMAVLVQNGMVITLFAHPVAHSNRQPNLALNPCPQRWVLSFMSHVFLAQRQQQHNPTIGCDATCIQTSSRRERGSLSARRAVLVENGVVITRCGKSNNRLLKQPPLQRPYTPPFSILDLLVPRTPCFSVHPANRADECRNRPVQQLKATRSR